jgi:hypothetical protein
MADTTANAIAQYQRHQNFPRIYTRAQREEMRAVGYSVAAQLHTRPILKLRFDFGSVGFDAELLDTPTAQAIKALLPIIGSAVTWEGGVYFLTDITIPLRDERTAVTSGEIAYCADPRAIAIGFGGAAMPRDDEKRYERPCNIWARALADVGTLAAVKDGTKVTVTSWLAPPPLARAPKRRGGRR